ncbi:MAG: hypothetical protein WC475_03980, partial [Candidatus Paceibacterota bacterium]
GPENYLVAYEKHYDPDYAVYGEAWQDRAHNKIFDLLVTQGVFGLLVYFGVFASAFYLLFRKRIAGKPFIMAGLIAYFVQNLVLFDQFNSDIAFFVILGFLIFQSFETEELKPLAENNKEGEKPVFPPKKTLFIFIPFAVAAAGFLGYSVYAYNYVPFRQSQAFQIYYDFGNNTAESVVKKIKKALYPYNFAQHNIRGARMDEFYLDKFFYNPSLIGDAKLRPVADLLIESMDELVRREPFDARVFLREVEMINGLTKVITDEKESVSLFEKAEALTREAVKLAPNRQEVYYHLAFNLAGQKRYDESISEARYAVSLNPKIVRAHYHLGLMLALAGKYEEAMEEVAVVEQLSPNFGGLMTGDMNTLLLIYDNQKRPDKVAEFVVKSLNGELVNFKFQRQYYEKALGYFAGKEDLNDFLLVADYLKSFEDLKDDMEVLADFAKSGEWDIKYIYNGEGRFDKIAGLLIKSLNDDITRHRFQRLHYETILGYFIYNEDSASSLKISNYLANFPDLKDNMEIIIDLIEKDNWTIIHNTFGI